MFVELARPCIAEQGVGCAVVWLPVPSEHLKILVSPILWLQSFTFVAWYMFVELAHPCIAEQGNDGHLSEVDPVCEARLYSFSLERPSCAPRKCGDDISRSPLRCSDIEHLRAHLSQLY